MAITIRNDVPWQGQDAFVIETPLATWYLQARAGGLASLVDRDGHDWISYRPGHGSAGEYRGIPNCGSAFHPGYPEGAKGSVAVNTRVALCSPDRAEFLSSSDDGAWAGDYVFTPDLCRFTLRKAAAPFWFLYEGTPGGRLELDRDFYVLPDLRQRPITEDWEDHLPTPRWVYFGKRGLDRGLFLLHHEPTPPDTRDQFWQMQGNMTVWGFGRRRAPMEKMLHQTPATLIFGLLERVQIADLPARIDTLVKQV